MSEFEKALQTTLQGMSEGFRQASADLHQEVAAASESISRLTGGDVCLTLVPVDESPTMTTYRLILEVMQPTLSGHSYDIVSFRVPANGYPISTGDGTRSMQDRKAIADFLTDMASRRDSPLVLYLAFLSRGQMQKPA